jgi:predicted nucleotidyltransferase
MFGVRLLEKNKVIGTLKEIAKDIKTSDPNIKKVILFGSLVNNNFTAASDADILIILKKDSRRPMDRIPEYLIKFSNAGVPVDIFPFTEEEIKRNRFLEKAKREGIELL